MEKVYVCPMHPEIREKSPGTCPKCGMALVDEGSSHGSHPNEKHERGYLPLLIVLGMIFLTTITLGWRDSMEGVFSFAHTISYFMIGFFLVFSGFKLLDLKGFAEGYRTYDVLASRWYGYGYLYPFIELFFGLAMIVVGDAFWLLISEIIVMTFSGVGVALKLLKREKFQCACLGTFLKVPLTKVTLIEDFGMAALALFLLFF